MDPEKVPQPPTILTKDNAVRLLEERCAESVLDEDFAIGPRFAYREVKEGIICLLTLPLPGAFRDISSDPSPTKDAAKESIAFMACRVLVELGRLHDVVVPIEILDDDSDDEDDQEEKCHDFIVIDSDDDDIPDTPDTPDSLNTVNTSGKFTDGSVYPLAHPIRSLHPSLWESQSFYLYAVSRTSCWKKGPRDACILTSKELDILPGDGSHTVNLSDHAREVKVFPKQLALTRSQLQVLGRFTLFVLTHVWRWDRNKIAAVDYLVAPVDLIADTAMEKVINWNEMKIQDTMEIQDFREHLGRIGYRDAVALIPSVMESLVAMSKARNSKAANLEAISAKFHPARRLDHVDRLHRISLGSQFQKCLQATHLFVDNPYWTSYKLTLAMNKMSESSKLESLGTALVEGGLDRAIMEYRTLCPEYTTFSRWSDLGKNHAKSLLQYGQGDGAVHCSTTAQLPGRERLEKAFGYSFKDPWMFWHARHNGLRFQRLEFLGDAVLDYVLFEYYRQRFPRTWPGAIMEFKTECVRNRTLSALALSWGLHLDIFQCPDYHAAADTATHDIQRMESLSSTKTVEGKYWLNLKLPKSFADQTEAFVGGIYADSGFNMDVMFQVVKEMIGPFMDRYVLPSVLFMFERDDCLNDMSKPTPSNVQSANLPCPKPLPANSVLMQAKPIATTRAASLLAPKKGGIEKKTHSAVKVSVIRTTDTSSSKMKSVDTSTFHSGSKGLVASFEKRSRRTVRSKSKRLLQEAKGSASAGLANVFHNSQGAGSVMTSGCPSVGINALIGEKKQDSASRTTQWCLSQADTQGLKPRRKSAKPAFASEPTDGPRQPFLVSAFKSSAPEKYIPITEVAARPESSMAASGLTYEPSPDVFSKSFLWAGSKPSSPLSLLARTTTDFSNWRPSITPAPFGSRRSSSTASPDWTDSSNSSPSKPEPATFTPGHFYSMGEGQRHVPAIENPVDIPSPLFRIKSATGPRQGLYRDFGTSASAGVYGPRLPTTQMFGAVMSCSMDSGPTPGVEPNYGRGMTSPASLGFSIPFSYGVPSRSIAPNPAPEKVVPLPIQSTPLDKDEDFVMLE